MGLPERLALANEGPGTRGRGCWGLGGSALRSRRIRGGGVGGVGRPCFESLWIWSPVRKPRFARAPEAWPTVPKRQGGVLGSETECDSQCSIPTGARTPRHNRRYT